MTNQGHSLEEMFKGDSAYHNSMLAYQVFTGHWVDAAFKGCKNADGEDVITSLNERNYRVFEEASELVQAGGMTREQMHKIVDMVCDKPVEPVIEKEVGGLLSTLAAFCNARSLDLWQCAVAGLKRNWAHIDAIRERQKNKPKMVEETVHLPTIPPPNSFYDGTKFVPIFSGNVTRPTPNLRWNNRGELEQFFENVVIGQRTDSASGTWKPIPREE